MFQSNQPPEFDFWNDVQHSGVDPIGRNVKEIKIRIWKLYKTARLSWKLSEKYCKHEHFGEFTNIYCSLFQHGGQKPLF